MSDSTRWSWRSNPGRFVALLVVVTIVGIVLGYVGGQWTSS
ncbi:hypothetical protein [Nocardioides ferulae]|nr:hypothetical protein [Nocardioides ferulae]